MAASTLLSPTRSIPGKKAGSKTSGKSVDSKRPAQPPIKCPECASQRIWKDGFRYVKSETATIPLQRFICRDCGRRFSENNCAPPNPRMGSNPTSRADVNLFGTYLQPITRGYKAGSKLSLSTAGRDHRSGGREAASFPRSCLRKGVTGAQVERKAGPGRGQVCTLSQKARMEKAAGATAKLTPAEIRGKLIDYSWYLRNQGYASGVDGCESTIQKRTRMLKRLVKLGVNLLDPESVKHIIAVQTWSEGTKANAMYAYESYMQMEGLTWIRPRYKYPQTLPFVPLESEIDQLIHACGKKVSIFLHGLKETGCDSGELWRVEWIDINPKARIISIKHPVKGHNPRILPISREFIARLELLPKVSDKIFPMTINGLRSNYMIQRRRKARNLKNPRLLKLTFRSIRHWKATMEYHKTRDILHVQRLLGHKTLKSTMVYIDIERAIYGQLGDDQFTVRVAHTLKEDQELIEAGFEYVTERDGAKIFRKRK